MICIYSIKYLISGKCDLDPVAKPQQASNHTIVLVRVKPSKICHIAHVLMKFECSIKYFYIHLNCKWFLEVGVLLIKGVNACRCLGPGFPLTWESFSSCSCKGPGGTWDFCTVTQALSIKGWNQTPSFAKAPLHPSMPTTRK